MGRKRNKRYRHQNGKLTEVAAPVVVTTGPAKAEAAKPTRAAVATDFKFIIPKDIYQKIMWWINKANFEVSGFGSLDWDKDTNTFTVRDAILLRQKVGPTSAEIDPAAMGKAMFMMKDQPNALKWHWHSHVNMGVFWSNDDMEIIRSLGQQGWIFASVFNKKEECKTAFLTQVEVFGRPHDLFVDDIKTTIMDYLPKEFTDQLDKEYDALVSRDTPAYTPVSAYDYPGRSAYDGFGHHRSHMGLSDFPTRAEVIEAQEKFADALDNLTMMDEMEQRELALSEGMSRWEPQVKAIPANEYNEYGYATVDGEPVYNPLHDDTLKTREECLDMVAEMSDAEILFLRQCDAAFDKLVRDYLVREASRPNGNVVDATKETPNATQL